MKSKNHNLTNYSTYFKSQPFLTPFFLRHLFFILKGTQTYAVNGETIQLCYVIYPYSIRFI